jgi:hypothetical protein
VSQVDQFICRVTHGRNCHDDIVSLFTCRDNATRNTHDARGIGDGRAAKLLNNE